MIPTLVILLITICATTAILLLTLWLFLDDHQFAKFSAHSTATSLLGLVATLLVPGAIAALIATS